MRHLIFLKKFLNGELDSKQMHFRKLAKNENVKTEIRELTTESKLEVFLKNLQSGLASEIEQCWIDPKKFSVECMIGQEFWSH